MTSVTIASAKGEIPVHCAHTRLMPIAELKKRIRPDNPNEHSDEQVERLTLLFGYYGIRHPAILWDERGSLEAGHGRLMAAERMGMTHFPVDEQSFRDEDEAYGFMVADNAIQQQWAELNLAKINLAVPELGPDFDIDLLGLKDFTIDVADKFEGDPDAVPEPPKVAKTKRGELWILGEHRVLCGDATDRADVERLMAGEKAEILFSDPPYGMNLQADYSAMSEREVKGNRYENVQGNRYENVQGDDEPFDPRPMLSTFDCAQQFLWGADYFASRLPDGGAWIVWSKRDEGTEAMIGNHFEVCWSRQHRRRELIHKHWAGYTAHDPGERRFHPTQKPIEVCVKILGVTEGQVVVDPYLGSGSTLIACEKTGKRCRGTEIDPRYMDGILTRWATFTGKDPVREDGVKWSELCAKQVGD